MMTFKYDEETQRVLKYWVKQPPTSPLIQYLRDAEKITTWKFINGMEKVLDIASESNITLGINAKHITRVDASLEASNLVKKILKNVVKEFLIINPKNPILPFPDCSFDAAVSIGPYDWLFLDINKLTKEVYRIVKEGGIFVISFPTVNSPYCTSQSINKFRYYTPLKIKKLINNSGWVLKEFVLIYQYPRIFYRISHALWKYLPLKTQIKYIHKPLIKFCWWKTKLYTRKLLWNKASYIIVALKKEKTEK